MSTIDQQFRELYERFYGDVVAWFGRRVTDRELARELAQDTFVRVYQGLEGRHGLAPWPWILIIAKRTFSNWLRSRATEKRGGLKRSDVKEVPEPKPGTHAPWIRKEDSPHEKTDRKEQIARLNQAIETLPDRARQVFLLRFRDDLTNPQIARQLDISVDTVKTHLRKARERIRAAFPDSPLEEDHDEH